MPATMDPSLADDNIPLVVHIVHRFECGGMQKLIAECINRMPARRYRHALVCLAGYTGYTHQISRPGVSFHDLNKPPGAGLSVHFKLWKLLRQLRPAIVHTYNIGTIEYGLTALLAGVKVRVHAEHGRDSVEIAGDHARYNLLRRLLIPVIDRYIPVSADLLGWLRSTIGVPSQQLALIPGGVDTERYSPSEAAPALFGRPVLIGTVGRIDRIKNHALLLDAFARLLERFPASQAELRLAIVGDGPLSQALRDRVASEPWADRVCLPGERADVAELMRAFSVFVLPSLSEATPVTVLEAMATALPVVASHVGGVPQLVVDRQTGLLIEPADLDSLVDALAAYIARPELRARHGEAGRARVIAGHSVDAMVDRYDVLYTRCLQQKAWRASPVHAEKKL